MTDMQQLLTDYKVALSMALKNSALMARIDAEGVNTFWDTVYEAERVLRLSLAARMEEQDYCEKMHHEYGDECYEYVADNPPERDEC
jgi:hypothetical protein